MARIVYAETPENISADQLEGFFNEWPKPPSAATLLRILHASDHTVVARDEQSGQVLGYITAISDGISAAYIPHLEVREVARRQGIGSELTRRLVERLRSLYMIDLVCDPELQPFYERLGFRPHTAMIIRNYDRQRCE